MRKTVYSLVSVMLFFFVSCGGGDSNDPNPSGGIHEVTSIEMSQTNATIHVGEIMELTAKFLPIDATNIPDYDWKTSDENVVELQRVITTKSGETASRKIRGRAAGTAIVTIQTQNGLSATCQVTVSNSTVNIENITFDKPEIEINSNGQPTNLLVTISPEYATDLINKALKCTSEDTDVATISNTSYSLKGCEITITGSKPGTTNIVVASNDGTIMAKCRVTVKNNNNVNYNPYGNDNQW